MTETVHVTFKVTVDDKAWDYRTRRTGEAEANLEITPEVLANIDPAPILRGLLISALEEYNAKAPKVENEEE